MAANQWITPVDPPTGVIVIALAVPEGDDWGAIVRGALSPLFDPANFQQITGLTPEETADYFTDALLASLAAYEECV